MSTTPYQKHDLHAAPRFVLVILSRTLFFQLPLCLSMLHAFRGSGSMFSAPIARMIELTRRALVFSVDGTSFNRNVVQMLMGQLLSANTVFIFVVLAQCVYCSVDLIPSSKCYPIMQP
ncbi:hypothetical protein BDQ12DRAFT_55787 [Crucibulum laeve]|uniref:Uncharacterized protein n=1 Tax=Crucibulum laeve TaxID=68775 RepID=A0A5C3M3J5_9AGAR|nr:hypothetical protein BDQ12DRAFT_55787 [Crucibulum laeve]